MTMDKETWKIVIKLADCDCAYDNIEAEEEKIPFLPHVRDIFWVSEKCEEALNCQVRECWRTHKEECRKTCPYIYGRMSSEEDITVVDAIRVKEILHDVGQKRVLIALSKR